MGKPKGGGGKRAGGNAGVGIDFKKVKHKVGKRLPKAQNETRTDFVARAINLPSQSVAADKAGAAVTARNLTLTELLGQLGHPSAKVRRDALRGLSELLTSHPHEARRHAAALLERAAGRLADGDAGARSELLAMLKTALLPALGARLLAPHLPPLLGHLEAAMTHLDASVRQDALAALEAVAAAAPGAFAAGGPALAPVLCHYAALLSRAHRGRSVKSQALAGLAAVFASLRRFLEAALPLPDDDAGLLEESSVAATHHQQQQSSAELDAAAAAVGSSDAPLMAHRAAWGPRPEALGPAQLLAIYAPAGAPAAAAAARSAAAAAAAAPAAAAAGAQARVPKAISKKRKVHVELGTSQAEAGPAAAAASAPASGAGAAGSSTAAAGGAPGATLRGSGMGVSRDAALQLIEALAAAWRECAPATLSVSPELEAAQALRDALACASLLVRGLRLLDGFGGGGSGGGGSADVCDRERAAAVAAALLPALLQAFPVTAPAARPPAAVAELLVRFNVAAAALLSEFVAAGVEGPGGSGSSGGGGGAAWWGTLLCYVHGALLTGVAVPQADALSAEIAPAAGGPSAQSGAAALLPPAVALLLLAAVERVLPRLCAADRRQLLGAVAALAGGDAAASKGRAGGRPGAVRAACLRLQRDLLLRHLRDAHGGGDPQSGGDASAAAAAAEMAAWLRAAPRALWQLGDAAPAVSGTLLSMLRAAACYAPAGSPLAAALADAQPQLAPLFGAALVAGDGGGGGAGGSKKQQQGKQEVIPVIIGPLARLPSQVQADAADLLGLLAPLHPALVRAAALAARASSYSDAFAARLLDGVLAGGAPAVDDADYASLLAALLAPRAGAAMVAHGKPSNRGAAPAPSSSLDAGLSRHKLAVDAAARWAHRRGAPRHAAALLESCLADAWRDHLAARDGAAGSAAAASEGVRCVAYSIVTVCALALGSWVPPRLAGSGCDGHNAAGDGGGDGDNAAALAALPPRLREVLPAAMAEQLLGDAAAAAAATAAPLAPSAAKDGAAASDAALAAAGAAAAESMRVLITQVLSAAAPALALPMLKLTVERASAGAAPFEPAAALAAAAAACCAALQSRALLPDWQAREPEATALSARLAGAAEARRAAVGDARAAAGAEKVAAVLSAVYAR